MRVSPRMIVSGLCIITNIATPEGMRLNYGTPNLGLVIDGFDRDDLGESPDQ
jgi:hypothetical protein